MRKSNLETAVSRLLMHVKIAEIEWTGPLNPGLDLKQALEQQIESKSGGRFRCYQCGLFLTTYADKFSKNQCYECVECYIHYGYTTPLADEPEQIAITREGVRCPICKTFM